MSVPSSRSQRERPAVMADVAKLAGVSHQTVSRVLHDSPNVRGHTRDRVLQAIRQLDYRPNSMARALATGRSKTLGVVTFDTTLYGPASTLLGIERAAHHAGYAVTIRWRWGCCDDCTRPGAKSLVTAALWASTTSRKRRTSRPRLTTVRQDFAELGRRCLHILLGRIEGDSARCASSWLPN